MTHKTREAVHADIVGNPSATDCDEKSSTQELERCSETTRRNITDTIQRMEDRISPNRLLDDAVGYVRNNLAGAENLSDLNRMIGKNPAPFAIMGLGLLVGGAGIAAYSFYKMRSAEDRSSPPSKMTAPELEIAAAQEAEMAARLQPEEEVVIPPSSAEPITPRMEEEASTEDIGLAETNQAK